MSSANSETCQFEHPLFQRLEQIVFRRGESDGAPVMIVPLGTTEAALRARALKSELGMQRDSPDARMFGLVGKALDFVPQLRLGDALPPEILGGEASWKPEDAHLRTAICRMRLRLLAVTESTDPVWESADPRAIQAAMQTRGIADRLDASQREAAAQLGTTFEKLHTVIQSVSTEFGYVEALRERLLDRATNMKEMVSALLPDFARNLAGTEIASRVIRLTEIALGKLQTRFESLDGCIAPLPAGLMDFESHRVSFKLHRDWLYCCSLAWEPSLSAWESAGSGKDKTTLALLGETYRFLAQRYLPMQEWQLSPHLQRSSTPDRKPMVW